MGLPSPRGRLSIRIKLLVLVASVISFSLAADIYLGSTLLYEDKVSYIYDTNSSGLKAAADAIESRIQDSLKVARLVGALPESLPAEGFQKAVEGFLALPQRNTWISGIAVVRAREPGKFSIERQYGKTPAAVQAELDRLGWNPEHFEKNATLLGDAREGELPVGSKSLDAQGAPIALLAFVSLDRGVIQDLPAEASVSILDSQGKLVVFRPEGGASPAASAPPQFSMQLQELIGKLPPGTEAAGTQVWRRDPANPALKDDTLVSYRRFAQGRLLLISLTPQHLAVQAASALAQRAVWLGLGLLAIALGTALLWARRMIERLRQLWEATVKVAAGDFSFRVQERKSRRDELSDLAASYNLMAGRITVLMAETAEKARMETELETAQAFQQGFFPDSGFRSRDLIVAGKYVPASECAGDWWHFSQIHQHLLLVMGDVTGHGASAAMLTAVVQGAYSQWVDQLRSRPDSVPELIDLIQCLNSVFFKSGRGRSLMTFLAISIDLRTGGLEMASASHLNPYLFRPGSAASADSFNSVFPLICGKSAPLGLTDSIQVQKAALQLQDGDRIFAFTDGFKENAEDNENKAMSKRKLLDLLETVFGKGSADPEELCRMFLDSRLGEGQELKASGLSDDMTILVAAVQPGSNWGKAPPLALETPGKAPDQAPEIN